MQPYNLSALPATAGTNFQGLVRAYAATEIEFPILKPITLAQWAIESGWGSSPLAKQNRNYAGMKWRRYMADFKATRVDYTAWDGKAPEGYGSFTDDFDFIDAFWARFDEISAYRGWRNHTDTEDAFMAFIGPKWVGGDRKAQFRYLDHIGKITGTYTRRAIAARNPG